MSEWIETTVGDLAASTRNALVGGPFGSNLVSKDYVDHGVPVIRGQNMGARWVLGDFAYVSPEKARSLSANTARPGDIVFTQRGTLGQVALIPNDQFETYVVSQSQMKLTVDPKKADSLFLYYLFSSPVQQEYIRQNSIQVGVPHTNLGILRDTPVCIPKEVDAQKVIARYLGSLDDKIELNRCMNGTLEAMARAIFQSWFVDFDPVRAKASGESADSICQRLGFTPELLALFPDSFEDSEFGEIPKGWKTAPFSEIAEVIMGQSPSGDTYNELGEGMPLINGPVEFGSFHPLKRKWTTSPIRQSEHGDLIVCVRGSTTGRHVKSDGIYCLGRGVAAMRSRTGHQPYVDQLFEHNLERMLTHATGSTFPSWSGPTLKQWPILLPLERLMLAYCEVATPLAKLSDALAHEVNSLVETRDALLPKFLSGSLPCTFSELIDEHT